MPTKLLRTALAVWVQLRFDATKALPSSYAAMQVFLACVGEPRYSISRELRSNTEAITQKLRKTTCDDFLTKHLQSSVGLSTG